MLENGDKDLIGLAKAALKWNPSGSIGPILFAMMKSIYMKVLKDAPLAHEFNGKLMVPIFFSHGLLSTGNVYSRILRDLARHGYMVVSISHLDGSSIHTTNAKGEDIYHGICIKEELEWWELRNKQLMIREKEMIALIEEFCFSPRESQ